MKMFHKKVVIIALLLTGCSLICANAPDGGSVGKSENKEKIDTTSATIAPAAAPTIPTPEPPTPSTNTTTTTITPAPSTAPSTTTTTTTPAPPTAPSTTTTTPAPPTAPSTTTTTTTPAPPTAPITTTTTTTVAPPTAPITTTTTTTPAPPTAPSTTTTTVAPPTTRTTIAPVTTTTAPTPSTPAPKPTPYPEPSIGVWNSSCILVKMAAQLNITYKTKDNRNATALYNIPSPPKAMENDASCGNITQTIQINWGATDAQDSMLLQFELKNKTSELTMMRFIISIEGDNFPNALENQTIQLLHRGNDFKIPAQMSYHCTRAQRFNLTETIPEKESVGFVVMHDVQVEAFRIPSNSTVFSAAHDCDSSDTPDIVPIAVGIALAAMIMIILTAYLCARRRSTSRGYMSF